MCVLPRTRETVGAWVSNLTRRLFESPTGPVGLGPLPARPSNQPALHPLQHNTLHGHPLRSDAPRASPTVGCMALQAARGEVQVHDEEGDDSGHDVVDLTKRHAEPHVAEELDGLDDIIDADHDQPPPFVWPDGPLAASRDTQLRAHPPSLAGLASCWPVAPPLGRHADVWQRPSAVGSSDQLDTPPDQEAFDWGTAPLAEKDGAEWRASLCAPRSPNARKAVDTPTTRNLDFAHATAQGGGRPLYVDATADIHLCLDVYDSSQDRGLGTDFGLLLFPGREVRRSVSLCRDDAPLVLWYFLFAVRLPSMRDGRMHVVLASSPVPDGASQCAVFRLLPLYTSAPRAPGGAASTTVRTISQVSMTDQRPPETLVAVRPLLAAAFDELPSLIEMEFGVLGSSRLATCTADGVGRDSDALQALQGADAAGAWANCSHAFHQSALWRPVALVPAESALLRVAWFRSRQADSIIKDLVARVATADDLRDKLSHAHAKVRALQAKVDASSVKKAAKLSKSQQRDLEAHQDCLSKRDVAVLLALKEAHAAGTCKQAAAAVSAKRKAESEVEVLRDKVRRLEREVAHPAVAPAAPVGRGGTSLEEVRQFMNPMVHLVEGAMSHLGRASNPSRPCTPARRTVEEIIGMVDEDMTVRLLAGSDDTTRAAFYDLVQGRLSVGAMLAVKAAVGAVGR